MLSNGHGASQCLTYVALAALWATVAGGHAKIFFKDTPEQVITDVYGGNPFVEGKEIGHFIRVPVLWFRVKVFPRQLIALAR